MRKSQVRYWGQSVYRYEAEKLDRFPGIRDAWRIDKMLDRFLKKKIRDKKKTSWIDFTRWNVHENLDE